MLGMCIESLGRCGAATPQRPSFLPLHGQTNGVQDQIHRLLCSSLISHDAVVIEIPDHGQIQYPLLRLDVRNICYPFAVGPVCVKLPVE